MKSGKTVWAKENLLGAVLSVSTEDRCEISRHYCTSWKELNCLQMPVRLFDLFYVLSFSYRYIYDGEIWLVWLSRLKKEHIDSSKTLFQRRYMKCKVQTEKSNINDITWTDVVQGCQNYEIKFQYLVNYFVVT